MRIVLGYVIVVWIFGYWTVIDAVFCFIFFVLLLLASQAAKAHKADNNNMFSFTFETIH